MEEKIIVIRTEGQPSELVVELQENLFKNGCSWINSTYNIKNYFPINRKNIIIIKYKMYSMSNEHIKFFKKRNIVKEFDDVTTYIRYMKLKKLNLI